ncbi:uncharacterized protein I206_102275 [Kwoniella pini CBS 10737]|uniref:Aminoglycoside phosphotransferase domain-containing protein n=1 Tax=Kwoniella pini CBS 10737 TaxID=1296096 RepID=A0A1B9HT27_9TREE|nr:uncharacterized protein I206_07645 [Kwoniella pini CBS 10737]OCF46411.1 hypothetical protein I206_07645 [Kwoniella pini CBS 10737]
MSAGMDDPHLKQIYLENRLTRFERLLKDVRDRSHQIIAEARHFRPDFQCELQIPPDAQTMLDKKKMYNGINIHFPLIWEDGVKWLLRVRQAQDGYPPAEIQQSVTNSEITVLCILNRNNISVPNAWYENKRGYNEGDLHYFFYEYLEGRALRLPKKGVDGLWKPGVRMRHIINQYAKFQIQVSDHPIPARLIGSPSFFPDIGAEAELRVGPLVNFHCLNRLEAPYFLGPFRNNQERYLAQIDLALSHIADGYICQNATLDGYLFHLQLKELVSNCSVLMEQPEEVYIKHADDKGDQFMGDENDNLTGVIDWEWAYVTTKSEAFTAPIFCFWSIKYFVGDNILSPAEEILIEEYGRLGRHDLADCVGNGKIYQRLSHIGTFDQSIWNQRSILDIFEKFKPAGFKPPRWVGKKWRVYLIDRYKMDGNLERLMLREGWDQGKEAAEVAREREDIRAETMKEYPELDLTADQEKDQQRAQRAVERRAAKAKRKATG